MNIQALFLEMHNPSSWRLNMGISAGTVPGFRCNVARIIETNSPCDKQSCWSRAESCKRFRKDSFSDRALGHLGKIDLPTLPRRFWMHSPRPEHTALDAACRKSVPGRFLRFDSWLLKEAN